MSPAFRVSVGANVALLAVAVVLFIRERPHVSEVLAPSAKPAAAERPAGPAKTAAISGDTTHPSNGPALIPDLIARLEQVGVSRSILGDVLREDFRRRWNKRFVALENEYAPRPPPRREYIALQRLEDAEQIRALKEAFGEEGYRAWDKEETLRKLNFEAVPMNATEADQTYRLQKQLDDKLREMQMAMEDGDADVSDSGKLQMQAQDAYEKDLQKLLGKQRYEQLKGYTIPVVEGHLEFNELNPTDAQVKALNGVVSEYQAGEAALARQLSDKPADAAAIAAELQKLNDAREENIRNTIGAEAYENLKREHDDTYQTLQQYADAWNLKGTEIEPVYDTIKAYVDNVDRLRKAAQLTELAGQTADWKAINSAIEQSRQQTEAALQNLIGGDRLSRVVRNGLLSPLGSERNAPHPPTGS